MAYDAQALQGFFGLKEDPSLDPSAGLVPLTSSLIPPIVAQAFGLPTLGSALPPPPPPPPQQIPPPQHPQNIYGQAANPALMGAFGFGGAQYGATIQSQLAGLPVGYLQALANQHQQQQQHHHHQQQQQQQSAAALLAQTAGAFHAHSAALAAAARAAPATSSALSQPMTTTTNSSFEAASGRGEHKRAATTSVTTNSSAPSQISTQAAFASAAAAAASASYQHPLMQNLYAALAQQHAAYGAANPAASYAAAAMHPYGASHLHSGYYARPPDASQSAAAAAAAAAAALASGAYGYQQLPPSVSYGSSFHVGYGAPSPLDYSALAAAYRPAGPPSSAAAPSHNPSQSFGEEDCADDGSTRAIKRPRLVWTPQLHKKFEVAVQKLGVDKAVPKNIMQEMNIDGLTRENVASHLQKYRMLRRKDTTSSEGRDSDTRTVGSKRSEPDSGRPCAPACGHAIGGGGGDRGGGVDRTQAVAAAMATASASALAAASGVGGGGAPSPAMPTPMSAGVSVKA